MPISHESQRAEEQARERLPLRRLLEQHGHGPKGSGEKWNHFTCPFCDHRKAGVVTKDGKDWFHCFNAACRSANMPGKNEVGVLALLANVSRKDAWLMWLKEAGVYREEVRAPSILPGSRARRGVPPRYPDSAAEEEQQPALSPQQQAPEPVAVHSVPNDGMERPSAEDAAEVPSGDGVSETTPEGDEVPALASEADEDVVFDSMAPEGAPPAVDEAKGRDDGKPSPLDAFLARSALAPSHRAEILRQRGLSAESVAREGFRSSLRSNRAILDQLGQEYPEAELVECGLWVPASENKPARPNPIFYGLGNSGKKDAEGRMVRGWTEPVLIPYWKTDDPSHCFYLRPHKDAVTGHDAHLYVPRGQPASVRRVMITEGEFKAAAFLEAGVRHCAAAAIPGISMVREDSPGSMSVLGELWRWLESLQAREVVIVFDNEDKSLRIPDRKKRFEAEKWARYLAIIAAKRGYKARVGHLPAEWREGETVVAGRRAGGKVDWDSALVRLRREGKTADAIRAAFTSVLDEAAPPSNPGQTSLFDSEDEKAIQAALARMFYKPKLARGGSREIKIARKLRKILEQVLGPSAFGGMAEGGEGGDSGGVSPAAAVRVVENVASAYQACVDRYYVLKRCLNDRAFSWWSGFLKRQREAGEHRLAFLAETVLAGAPVSRTDFFVDWLYLVRRFDGDVHRRCRLVNVHGESRLLDLGGEVHSPVRFRERCITAGPFTWGGNENELQALREDMNAALVGQVVNEVTAYGWHEKARMWIASDGAIADGGEYIFPDEDGIIWREGVGYLVSETDREGEAFRQGHPAWRLSMGLRRKADETFVLAEGEDDPAALQDLAYRFLEGLFGTTSSADAWMALGSLCAYAVGPELFGRLNFFPGQWTVGMRGGGKSTMARIFMRFFGFSCDSGLALASMTGPGLLIAMQQQEHLPVWLDDYRPDVAPAVKELLRTFWDRSSGSKKEGGRGRRMVRTNAIVTSEHSAGDSATFQRFVHLHLAEERRSDKSGETLAWFQEVMPLLFTLWRALLRSRKRFGDVFFEEYARWGQRDDLRHLQERTKNNYGVAYAAMRAYLQIFNLPEMCTSHLERAALAVVEEGDQTARAEGNMTVFFSEMVTSFSMGALAEENGGVRRYFNVEVRSPGVLEVVDDRLHFPSMTLYFDAASIHAKIRERLRRSGRAMPIELSDLKQQMSAQPYWVGSRRMRLRNDTGQGTYCWALDLDRHPLGRRHFDSPEAEAAAVAMAWEEARARAESQRAAGESSLAMLDVRGQYVDPRAGDLHMIAQAVLDARKGDER